MFQFKNETRDKVYLAFGYFDQDKDSWMSEGWWSIEPQSTVTPYSKKLTQRYYYYYAYSSTGVWKGETRFCTTNQAFTLEDNGKCKGKWQKFRVIDTESSKTYLLRLTDDSSADLSDDEQELIKCLRGLR